MRTGGILLVFAVCAVLWAGEARADWDPGDACKMHYPQLPDPNGWDVAWTTCTIADDWQCTQTGPVSDIHLWVSFEGWSNTYPAYVPGGMTVRICENVQDANYAFSFWGEVLWSKVFDANEISIRLGGYGNEGWLDPPPGSEGYQLDDHQTYFQINLADFADPFIQEANTIYWLNISFPVDTPLAGWKTSNDHFGGDAVYRYVGGVYPNTYAALLDPITGEGLDLAFVITPEPATLALLALGGAAILRRKRHPTSGA